MGRDPRLNRDVKVQRDLVSFVSPSIFCPGEGHRYGSLLHQTYCHHIHKRCLEEGPNLISLYLRTESRLFITDEIASFPIYGRESKWDSYLP